MPIQQIEWWMPYFIAGFALGVGVATWIFLVVTSGIRPRPPQRHTWRDCDERYD